MDVEGRAQIKESGQCHTPVTLPSRKKPPVTTGNEPG